MFWFVVPLNAPSAMLIRPAVACTSIVPVVAVMSPAAACVTSVAAIILTLAPVSEAFRATLPTLALSNTLPVALIPIASTFRPSLMVIVPAALIITAPVEITSFCVRSVVSVVNASTPTRFTEIAAILSTVTVSVSLINRPPAPVFTASVTTLVSMALTPLPIPVVALSIRLPAITSTFRSPPSTILLPETRLTEAVPAFRPPRVILSPAL